MATVPTTTTKIPAPRLLISAPWKSSGKTLVTTGLAAALRQNGLRVHTFKKGLDFIDPLWHAAASGHPSRNLDLFTQGVIGVQQHFATWANGSDINLIEGNHGYFDGQDMEGSDCTAALAKVLEAPVVLVVNCAGIARGVAPLILGQRAFPGGERIRAVILNNVAASRQEKRLRQVLEHFCPEVELVGVLSPNRAVGIEERHLGLVPVGEQEGVAERIAAMADQLRQGVDLERLLTLARSAPPLEVSSPPPPLRVESRPGVRVAYAADRAFHFYYPENLESLRANGVELVPIDLLTQPELPSGCEGLYIGGGFPEMFLEQLAANQGMLTQIRRRAASGLRIYAECGGLMYLSQKIRWGERQAAMAAALPIEVTMERRPQGHGYMTLEGTGKIAWPAPGQVVNCHEFHYSRISQMGEGVTFAYRVRRGSGVDGEHDGLCHHNILASYAHIHAPAAPGWAPFLAAFWRGEAVCS